MLNEYPGVSSCVGSKTLVKTVTDRHSLDPELSPDSDVVYNPVVDVVASPVEASNLTIQDSGLTQSAIVPEGTVLGDMHAKFSYYSEAIISPESASSLNLLQLQTDTKNTKKDWKICKASQKAYASSEHVMKEKLHNSEIQDTTLEPLKKHVEVLHGGLVMRWHLRKASVDWKVNLYHKGEHGFFIMTVISGVAYQLHLLILLRKPTIDGIHQ
ncbi:hypothetical protein OPV22_016408 [Ensete ventricosum]|uniref:Uncharacterized protein n=1 Tax=Ensete ventricosum TaxID=4639 RepID=A0AAV8QTR2_ENSVE|nr:hypothetical protein OPV22_016408 [Ensete ventricosum]